MKPKKATKAELKRGGVIQWAAKWICIGYHYCEEPRLERFLDAIWVKTGEVSKFFYAYDLTSYHVASGDTPMKAIEALLHVLWGGDVIAKEIRDAGGRVRRNKLHLEHPEALRELWAAMHKWDGKVIGDMVEWKRLLTPHQRKVVGMRG